MANFLQALGVILSYFLELLKWLVIIRALLSWVNPDPYNPIVQFIERTTEPVLLPFRQLLPSYKLGIDLSPLLALLFIYFLQMFAVQTLLGLAIRLR
jgi:YggT family protein